jgi:hypothetical protein
MATIEHKLADLDTLRGFKVASDESDPRGWTVVSCDNDEVGVVRTILVDIELMKARYLVTDLSASSRTVLLPVPLARLDDKAKRVIFDVSPRQAFAELPAYGGTEPTPEEDDATHRILAGTESAHGSPESSLDRRHSDRRVDGH